MLGSPATSNPLPVPPPPHHLTLAPGIQAFAASVRQTRLKAGHPTQGGFFRISLSVTAREGGFK